jgi:hypothetical protein
MMAQEGVIPRRPKHSQSPVAQENTTKVQNPVHDDNLERLVAALTAGGVPFCAKQWPLAVGSEPGRQCHSTCERLCPRVKILPPPPNKTRWMDYADTARKCTRNHEVEREQQGRTDSTGRESEPRVAIGRLALCAWLDPCCVQLVVQPRE